MVQRLSSPRFDPRFDRLEVPVAEVHRLLPNAVRRRHDGENSRAWVSSSWYDAVIPKKGARSP